MPPENIDNKNTINIKGLESNTLGKIVSVSINSWNVDIQVFKIIFGKFKLFLPFLISVLVILAVILIPLLTGFDGRLLAYGYQNQIDPIIFISFIVFIYSFICCSVFVFGYLFLGYLLRRKYLNINEGAGTLISRYIRLLGTTILLSLVWVILLLITSKKKKDNRIISGENVGHGLLDLLKFTMYINIVRVALGDERSSLKETYRFIKDNFYSTLRVWFGSGLLVGSLLFLCLLALFPLTKFGLISVTETTKSIIAPVAFSLFAFFVLFKMFAIQIGVFAIYLKNRYSVDLI